MKSVLSSYSQISRFQKGTDRVIGDDKGKPFLYHSGRTGIGFSTLCIAYPYDKSGIMILVNDNLSQENISNLGDKIKAALIK